MQSVSLYYPIVYHIVYYPVVVPYGTTNMTRLTNKIAIVAGSSSGIGHGIALRYASEGAKIVCAISLPSTRTELVT